MVENQDNKIYTEGREQYFTQESVKRQEPIEQYNPVYVLEEQNKANVGVIIATIFFPIVGIIMYFVEREKNIAAKKYLITALVMIGVSIFTAIFVPLMITLIYTPYPIEYLADWTQFAVPV